MTPTSFKLLFSSSLALAFATVGCQKMPAAMGSFGMAPVSERDAHVLAVASELGLTGIRPFSSQPCMPAPGSCLDRPVAIHHNNQKKPQCNTGSNNRVEGDEHCNSFREDTGRGNCVSGRLQESHGERNGDQSARRFALASVTQPQASSDKDRSDKERSDKDRDDQKKVASPTPAPCQAPGSDKDHERDADSKHHDYQVAEAGGDRDDQKKNCSPKPTPTPVSCLPTPTPKPVCQPDAFPVTLDPDELKGTFCFHGDVDLDRHPEVWSAPCHLKSGVFKTDGKFHLGGHDVQGNVTLVANQIDIEGSGHRLTAFTKGVLACATGHEHALRLRCSDSGFKGLCAAKDGDAEVCGDGNLLVGMVMADCVSLSGSNNDVRFADLGYCGDASPTPTPVAVGTPSVTPSVAASTVPSSAPSGVGQPTPTPSASATIAPPTNPGASIPAPTASVSTAPTTLPAPSTAPGGQPTGGGSLPPGPPSASPTPLPTMSPIPAPTGTLITQGTTTYFNLNGDQIFPYNDPTTPAGDPFVAGQNYNSGTSGYIRIVRTFPQPVDFLQLQMEELANVAGLSNTTVEVQDPTSGLWQGVDVDQSANFGYAGQPRYMKTLGASTPVLAIRITTNAGGSSWFVGNGFNVYAP